MELLSKPRERRRCWNSEIPPSWLLVCGAIAAQVGFGLFPVVVRRFTMTVNPFIFSFYKDVGCFPALLLLSYLLERRLLLPSPRMTLLFLVLGLLGMFGGQVLFLAGVYLAGASIASAFQPLAPVWTAVLAYASCIESLPSPYLLYTWTKFGAIGLAVGGAIEATLTSPLAETTPKAANYYLLGCGCLFGNTLSTAMYVLVQKRFIFNKTSSSLFVVSLSARKGKWKDYPVMVTAYSYFFGAIFVGLASFCVLSVGEAPKNYKVPTEALYGLLFAVTISVFGSVLITWTNKYLSATIVTAFWPLQVVVSLISSILVNGEQLAPWQYLGVAMVIAGLFLLLFSNHNMGSN